ncbi:MAG: tetratricopeptide repeat protein, partial [Proteobacteria bacterium]|nr:tetratricopeptide repeat protein [Pseudomonadota bacterium]
FAKVIDFGIAKATAGEERERTLATRIHQVMGTPLYMSPEQAIGSLDIDIRTDVYSLGVILYELLTGTTPVEREKLASISIADTQRLICQSDPPKPSARVLSNATTLTGSASFRPTDPRKLARTIRGDLDWIVMKALEKEPERRYQSAAEFAEDLRRYLSGEEVMAVPPSLAYRTSKFVRRNKTVVAAGALIGLSLIAGIVAFAWQARIAQKRADDLTQVTAFEAEMFEQIDPANAGEKLAADLRIKFAQSLHKQGLPDEAITQRLQRFDADFKQINATDAARDVIDQNVLRPAAASIENKFGKQPLIAAQLRQSLAKRYLDMGMYDAALPLQLAALETFRRLKGEDAAATAIARFNVGTILQQKGDWAKAEKYYLGALATARKLGELDSQEALSAMGNLGVMYADQGRFALAEPYYRQVLEARQRLFGNDAPDTLLALQNMGSLLRTEGKYVQAEPYLREAAAAQERVSGPTADSTLYALGNIALLEQARGRHDLAEKQIAEVLARARRAYGETYPTTLLATIILGDILEDQGKHAQAERLLAGIDAPARQTFNGDNAYWRGMLLCHLGKARGAQGNYAPAEANLLEGRQLLTIPHAAQEVGDLHECTQALVDLYSAWDKAEPGKGHAAKAVEWKARLTTPMPQTAASATSSTSPRD